MSKLYKLFFIIIVLSLFILNISISFYNKEITSYFRMEIEREDSFLIQSKIDKEYFGGSFDVSMLSNPKFMKLKDFSVDLVGFDLPEHLSPEEGIFLEDPEGEGLIDGVDPQTDPGLDFPEFEVGNKNPFEPFSR